MEDGNAKLNVFTSRGETRQLHDRIIGRHMIFSKWSSFSMIKTQPYNVLSQVSTVKGG